MKESTINLPEAEAVEFVEGLRGRVFHVTYARNMASIRETGFVGVNSDSSLRTTFGNAENGFYRKQGCVSVFDYEEPSEEKWREHMWKCNPLMPARVETVALLFLSELGKKNLIRWSQAKEQWTTERVVPHVEAGHKGNIPLSCISELLTVHLELDKTSIAYRLSQTGNPDRR